MTLLSIASRPFLRNCFAPGQVGRANVEATLADVVPPETGTPEDEAWSRLLAALAERGVPSPASGR